MPFQCLHALRHCLHHHALVILLATHWRLWLQGLRLGRYALPAARLHPNLASGGVRRPAVEVPSRSAWESPQESRVRRNAHGRRRGQRGLSELRPCDPGPASCLKAKMWQRRKRREAAKSAASLFWTAWPGPYSLARVEASFTVKLTQATIITSIIACCSACWRVTKVTSARFSKL